MELRDMIKEAISGFLGNSGSLTDIIGEMSQRENLNEHMIRRVCVGANTETRLHFYRQPGVNQASALFPVADAESIINMMFPEASSESSTPIDYMLPPPTATIKVTTIESEEDTPEPEPKEDKRKDREKEARLYLAHEKFKGLRENFFKEARQYLLNHRNAADINKMASHVDGQETLRAVYPTFEEYLVNYNLQKSAADIKDYLNKDLQVTYVIGDNPLVIKYKTLMENCNKLKDDLKGEIHHQVLK
jgi:hypothetical protein